MGEDIQLYNMSPGNSFLNQKPTSSLDHHQQSSIMPLFRRRVPVQQVHRRPSTVARLKAMFTPHPHPHRHTHGYGHGHQGHHDAPVAPVGDQVRAAERSLFRRTPGAHSHPATNTRRRNPFARRMRGPAQAAPVATGDPHYGHHGHRSTLASLKAMFRPRRSHGHRTQYIS